MSELIDLVARRLDADDLLDDSTRATVREALGAVDTPPPGGAEPTNSGRGTPWGTVTAPAAGVFLSDLTVRSFRGIGAEARLPLVAGPGLTIVSGRNGSGKSSFAEALEVTLTGTSYRWHRRSAQWQDTWRNLHCDEAPRIDVGIVAAGGARARVTAEWDDPGDLPSQHTAVTGDVRIGDPRWSAALEMYRPLLTYEELGQILTARPSELFDKLSTVLGLEQLDDAIKQLDGRRKTLDEPGRQLRLAKSGLVDDLRAAGDIDRRITEALNLVKGTRYDAPAIRALATGTAPQSMSGAAALRALVDLTGLDPAAAETAAAELRAAVEQCAETADDATSALRRRLAVVETALDAHEHDGDMQCPVCGTGTLDAGRAAALRNEAADASEALRKLVDATARLARARTAARAVIRPVPSILTSPVDPAVDTERSAALHAWKVWGQVPEGDLAVVEHIGSALPVVASSVVHLRAAAAAALTSRDDTWAPLASRLAAFADLADQVSQAKPEVDRVGAAMKWLKDNSQALKNERLVPIRDHAARIWEQLRQESNVEIADLTLTGSATRRRVVIEAAVDGRATEGIGVLSQGELHALSLALFLPRAVMDASPFRFVVLDDPVQAMDPAKVDGLVEALSEIAETRQVIVFSHDDRLAAAVRRAPARATIVEVTRGPSSAVAITNTYTPARRYLQDAAALCKDTRLPETTLRQILPGMLRMAIEAASRDRFYAAALAAGVPHVSVENRWNDKHETRQRVTLALSTDATEWSQAPGRGYRKVALAIVGTGVHSGLLGDPENAIDAVRKTVRDLVDHAA